MQIAPSIQGILHEATDRAKRALGCGEKMTEAQNPDPFDIDDTRPSDGVGLCLSGGGYRAMLFHLGALRLLNEAGWLPKLTRVASVSGGSIVAGVLGLAWKELAFNENGVATRFADMVERPILLLGGSTIDIPAVMTGLWPGRIAERVAKAYDKALFHGRTLQDLPSDADGPRFIFLATDLSNATLWRLSKPYMRTWRSEPILNPTLSLGKAVASSSAFPPVLSPSLLRVDGRTVYLICGPVLSRRHGWAGLLAGCVETGPVLLRGVFVLPGCVSCSTRGQTDMRGLVTAGRAVRRELGRWSKSERGHDRDHKRC